MSCARTVSVSLLFRDSLLVLVLVLVQGLLFQSLGGALGPALVFLAGLSPLCPPPGPGLCRAVSAPVPVLPACRFFSPGPQRHPCFSWAEGRGVLTISWLGSQVDLPPPVLCAALSKFLSSTTLKNSHKTKFPQDGKQKRKCCCHWEHKGPLKGSPTSASLP